MKTAFLLVGVFWGCCNWICRAQLDLRHQTLSTWGIQQGLPQDFITALDQTPDGFLWVGTVGGLARFDGLNFRTNFPGDPPALHGSVHSIGHDASGLWVGTSSGLLRERHGNFHFVTVPDPGPPYIRRMVVSRGGGVWVDTGQHLWKLDADEKTVHRIDTSGEHVGSFAEDPAGTLWIITPQSVLALHRDGSRDRYPMKNASVLTAANDGRIYVGDGHRLYEFVAGGFRRVKDPPFRDFSSIIVAHDGALWFASGGLDGIARVDAQGVQRLEMMDGLTSNDARVMMEDHEGGMWIGTISGLQWLHRGAFVPFSTRDGLPSSTAQYDAMFASHDGRVWTGTVQHGIAVFDGDRWRTYGVKEGLRRGQIRGFADDDGPMPFVALESFGLYRWNGKRYFPIPGVPRGPVTAPLRAKDGSVWFSVRGSGIFRLRSTSLKRYAAESGLTDTNVLSLLEDGSGGMYAGVQSGLFHFDGTRWSRVYPEIHSLVAVVRRSSRGELLVGTSAGLQVLRGIHMQTLGRSQGLIADGVFDIQEDADGSLWLANPVGISRLLRKQLDEFLDHKRETVSPELYTERDGLPFRDLLPISDVLTARATDGRLWIATTRGPAAGAWLPESAPHAVVDGVSSDGIVQRQGEVILAPGRHRLTFAFTAPSFTAPEQLRFRYRLAGWDTGWVDAGRMREVSYTGLPPGRYRLEVQAIGRGGNDGPIATGDPVELRPFLWQTRSFLFSIAAVLAMVVMELTRRGTLWRTRRAAQQFEARTAERERIARQLHDTVIQDLVGAMLHLEIAEMKLAAGGIDPRRQLEQLTTRLSETVARSRNMVASLHSTAHPRHSLLEMLRLTEGDFRIGGRPVFSLSHSGDPEEFISPVDDEVYRICREAIANAFRHSGAESVRVHVEFEARCLRVEIEDDGIGMDTETNENGRPGHFGLSGMRARSQRIGAQFEIDSAPGEGTTVRLQLRSSRLQRIAWRIKPLLQWSVKSQVTETQTPGELS